MNQDLEQPDLKEQPGKTLVGAAGTSDENVGNGELYATVVLHKPHTWPVAAPISEGPAWSPPLGREWTPAELTDPSQFGASLDGGNNQSCGGFF